MVLLLAPPLASERAGCCCSSVLTMSANAPQPYTASSYRDEQKGDSEEAAAVRTAVTVGLVAAVATVGVGSNGG